jgi:peroxiredoxin
MTDETTSHRRQAGSQATTALLLPVFTLRSTPDQSVSLHEFRGQPVVLAFYPADWSPVCGDELAIFNEVLPEFHDLGATLAGISVDGVWCHAAFTRNRNLHFPLLADFEPKGAVPLWRVPSGRRSQRASAVRA